jgi:adenylate cyclase
MSGEAEQRKLAAIMFTDMVGYSALSQRDEKLAQELLEEHRRLLREIFPRFNGTEIKTIGDAFLVEFGSALEAAQCAIEIQRTLAKRNADIAPDRRIELKIGIHIGDVVHRGGDVYGDGVNIASRIEPVAGPGGICVSMDVERQIRNTLEARFEKLAPTELKNISVPMDLFRIVLPWERPSLTAAKSENRKRQSGSDKSEIGTRSRRIFATSIAIVLLSAGLLGYQLWRTRNQPAPRQNASPARTEAATIPAKSIAVLPFENLSAEKQNEYFADGVQDEILTHLARIADLKVISRTSVMQYKSGVARNLRKIGEELGVAHVLEGSVQRAANKVRVNAQLVDARNDTHLWAQTYDRDLADVFAIQSEIAKAIADQLQAKLSPSEKKAIDLHPTNDLVAFDLYTRAKDLILTANLGSSDRPDVLQAIELLNQAVARDRSFFDAYCQLANAHGFIYLVGFDHTAARLALAEAAVEAAARLRPDAGETHLARALNLYQGHRDYNGALAELELARQTLPNDSRIYQLIGFIQRRQKGRYEESTRTLEHAIDLDPRNVLTLSQIAAYNYPRLRRYADARSAWDRSLAIRPDDNNLKVGSASVDFDWKADTRPMHQTIESIRATNPEALQTVADKWLLCALAERDADAAENALIAAGEKPISPSNENVLFTRQCVEGVIARMTHDDAAARSAFTAARAEQEKIVQAQPGYSPAVCVLGLIDAGLGRKEEAIREGRRAIELLPVEKDLPEGMDMIKYLAMIAAWAGDNDLACEQLAIAISGPSALSYGELKLLPLWDPLRADPRFEKIVASLAPK